MDKRPNCNVKVWTLTNYLNHTQMECLMTFHFLYDTNICLMMSVYGAIMYLGASTDIGAPTNFHIEEENPHYIFVQTFG